MSENTIQKIDIKKANQAISKGLERVAEVAETIKAFKEKSKEIAIKDNDDKLGYNSTKEFLSELRPARTDLDKERKTATKPFRDLVSQVNDAYGNAIDEIAEIEKPHKKAKEAYETALEEKKEADKQAEEKRIASLIGKLIENGMVYNPTSGYYELGNLSVTVNILAKMDEEEFTSYLNQVSEKNAIVLEEKAAAERLDARKRERTNRLLAIPASRGHEIVTIDNLETELQTVYPDQAILNDDDETFERNYNDFVSVRNANFVFKTAIANQKAENERKQKELAAAEQKQKEQMRRQQELQKQQQEAIDAQNAAIKQKEDNIKVQEFAKELEQFGFKPKFASSVSEASFLFDNGFGKLEVKVSELLSENGSEIFNTNLKSAIDFNNAKTSKEIADKNAAEEKAKQEKLDLIEANEKAKQKEAENKSAAKPDFATIEPIVNQVMSAINGKVEGNKLAMIGAQWNRLFLEVSGAVESFNESTKHLR